MKTFLIILLFSALIYADSTYVSPSLFYTHGSYSTGTKSNAASLYNTLQLSEKSFLYTNFDMLKLTGDGWDYKQYQIIGGSSYYWFPFYLKAHAGYIKGDFDYPLYDYNYSDFTNIFNLDAFIYSDMNYLGLGYTHINKRGDVNYKVNQLTLRLERILSDDFFISIKPNLSLTDTGDKYYSAALKLHYLHNPYLIFKTGGFYGKRIFYFDSDLLTIYNQPALQEYQLFFQADYFFNSNFGIILSYQHTKFDLFTINYIIAGVKLHLYL